MSTLLYTEFEEHLFALVALGYSNETIRMRLLLSREELERSAYPAVSRSRPFQDRNHCRRSLIASLFTAHTRLKRVIFPIRWTGVLPTIG